MCVETNQGLKNVNRRHWQLDAHCFGCCLAVSANKERQIWTPFCSIGALRIKGDKTINYDAHIAYSS